MPKKRIFVSCGQRTPDEKRFGQAVLHLIGQHEMVGFFADEAHDASDLNTAIFKELQTCDGFVAILQKRGEVRYGEFSPTHRASVWIQQEIAIVFYRSFLLQRNIPMRVYMENGILHEGLTTVSIINPIPFESTEAVLEDLSTWLAGPTFEEQPVLARRENLFRRRIGAYQDHHWLVLELIAAHTKQPGDVINSNFVRNDFYIIATELGHQEYEKSYEQAWVKLREDGLISRTENPRE